MPSPVQIFLLDRVPDRKVCWVSREDSCSCCVCVFVFYQPWYQVHGNFAADIKDVYTNVPKEAQAAPEVALEAQTVAGISTLKQAMTVVESPFAGLL